VKAAIERGKLAPERLERWRKLKREDARNSESLAASHARDRAFGRIVRQVKEIKKR
jgi:ribosome biogenesis GTPase / thiamine phosphate phosphatase